MRRWLVVGILSLIALPGVAQGNDELVLYDVDFGTPPHTVGLPPVVGGGPPPREKISDIRFGLPIVVADLGPLVDQPLKFEYGDQIALDLDDLPTYDSYTLECDLMVVSVQGRFSIFFDAPTIRRISFRPDGTVDIYPWDIVIGSYDFNEIVNLRVDVNLVADTWTIFLDGLLVHDGTFNPATQINTVRFSSLYGGLVGLDNIVIATMVPVEREDTSWTQVKNLYR